MNDSRCPLLASVRTSKQLTQANLAEQSGVSQAVISGIERGRTPFAPEVAQRLAGALDVSVELVTSPTPAVRIVAPLQSSLPAQVTKTLTAELTLAHFHLRRLLGGGSNPIPVPGSDRGAKELARQLRESWAVPAGPISNLVALVEQHGVACIVRDTSAVRLDAVGSWPDGDRPIVFLNNRVSPRERRLALALELGHVLARPDGVDAHEFAAEFLMPSADVTWCSVGPLTWTRLGELEEHWGLPSRAVLVHARRVGAVSATQHRHLTSLVREMGTKAARAYAEEPSLVVAAVRQVERDDGGQAAARMLLSPGELRRRFLAGARG